MTWAWIAVAWKVINSPIGRGLGIGAIALSLWAFAENRGAERVRSEWEIANAEAQAKVEKTDREAAEKAGTVDKTQTAESEETDRKNREEREAYVRDLEKRVAKCGPASPADIRRLRNIR